MSLGVLMLMLGSRGGIHCPRADEPRHIEGGPGALAGIREGLGLAWNCELGIDFHSMLVYDKGQFFVTHQDSETDDAMMGTLVVTLPSAFTGGELLIGQGEEWKAHRDSKSAHTLVAFYADRQHKVLPVKSGYRVTLTYNLLMRGDTSGWAGGDDPAVAELAHCLTGQG